MRPRSLFLTRRSFLSAPLAAINPLSVGAQDLRNTELAHPKTHFVLRTWNSRGEWERYRFRLRRQILGSAGLIPQISREDVSVRILHRTRNEDYGTEALLFETLPGYFVGGTIYHPLDTTRRWPGVLLPHGHWKHGRVENLPTYSVPALGINLAQQGYVAFSWDMVGYNDTRQTPHDFGGWREQLWGFTPLGLQVWNGIRALDYLISRPDVDGKKIACTGASGGATQTILLTAVDRRITCSAPVNMISANYQGADPCEEAPNLRLGTNNVEIAAMMAPRPMLVVSCTGDWTRNTPQVEYPAIQRIYNLYNKVEAVSNAHFDAEHNYDRRTREAVYRFLAKHLRDEPTAAPQEKPIPEIRVEDLLARKPDSAPSPEALSYSDLFEEWRAMSRRQSTADASDNLRRIALRTALMCEEPQKVIASGKGDRLVLNRPGMSDRVPVLWFPGRGTPVVFIHPDGSMAANTTEEMKQWRVAGRPVLAVDVFQSGLAQGPRERGGRWFLSYNQTDDANRVQDIITALIWLRSQTRDEPELVGVGKAAVWVTFAAAAYRHSVSVVANLKSFSGLDEELKDQFFVPCVQRAGGLASALKLIKRIRPNV